MYIGTEPWCFFTDFVCAYNDLQQAKVRHMGAIDGVRHLYFTEDADNRTEFSEIVLCSEQALHQGHNQPFFDEMFSRIVDTNEDVSWDDKGAYANFCFMAVINIPALNQYRKEKHIEKLASMLALEFEDPEDPKPVRFPSKTRAIRVSKDAREIPGCSYQ
ncbi:hypothetical protein [Corynebacterium heidelbergense]|uniref:Uncharacterized protein n=1 Tax=Corynebacterium heidelbergense TaxID=2055947 RepID=A0A364VBD1_9CORY|nr:hypothetical protein [Corynebacterium heidelbergense]RAV33924.1 hypothetical protein CWC39_05860 [Corynebacterium heidelbergense]WCZ35624.1 hypothetical protein CHEID_00210 [Corynebacterium heidelbergense]